MTRPVRRDVSTKSGEVSQERSAGSFFQTLLDRLPLAVAVLDSENLELVWANLAYRELPIRPWTQPETEGFRRALEEAKAFSEPEIAWEHPGGNPTYWRLSAFPFERNLLVAFDEVTTEVEARHARERVVSRLAESDDRYRRMGNLIPFGFWAADAAGSLTYVSESFLELTGATQEECSGLGWLRWVHPDDRAQVMSSWEHCVREVGFWDHEHRIVGKNGRYFTLLSRGVPIRDEKGATLSWAGINLDITDRKRFVAELRAAKEAAEAANRAKDRFLSTLSHELRTPLNPVLAAVQILEAEPALPPELRPIVATIRRNAELEARLIDDLLDLTRIFRGDMELHPEAVDVRAILENVSGLVGPELVAKDLALTSEFEAEVHDVQGDAGRLQQVFWHLLKNAIKFTEPAGTIRLRTRSDGSRLLIEVSDTGIGIEPAELGRLFSAFGSRTDDERTGNGLGLGLSISKAIIEMHGGEIEAMSDGTGRGATFVVSLDANLGRPSSSKVRTAMKENVCILLVDDHKDTCLLMESMLARRGYRVMTAADVRGALELASHHEFDVLVSDVGLPDASGLDLMRTLRGRQIPGIALTGYGRDDDVRNSREAGFAEHMTKPVNIAKLEEAIRRLIKN